MKLQRGCLLGKFIDLGNKLKCIGYITHKSPRLNNNRKLNLFPSLMKNIQVFFMQHETRDKTKNIYFKNWCFIFLFVL